MNKEEYIATAEESLFHVYNRFPVVFEKGKGVHIYDTDGKEYLDFASGIGVMAFGYNDGEYKQALMDRIDKITHTSNLYYHPPMISAAKNFVRYPAWIRCSLPTVVPRRSKEPLRLPRNMLICAMDLPDMRSLPWNILSTAGQWDPCL